MFSKAEKITLTTQIKPSDAKRKGSEKYSLVTREKIMPSKSSFLELGIIKEGQDPETIEWIGSLIYEHTNGQKSLEIWDMHNTSEGQFTQVGAALHEIAFRKSLSIPECSGRVSLNSTSKAIYFHTLMGFSPVNDKIFDCYPKDKELLHLCEKYHKEPNDALKMEIVLHERYQEAFRIAQERLEHAPSLDEVIEFGVFSKVSDYIRAEINKAKEGGQRITGYSGNCGALYSGHRLHLTEAVIQQKKAEYGISDTLLELQKPEDAKKPKPTSQSSLLLAAPQRFFKSEDTTQLLANQNPKPSEATSSSSSASSSHSSDTIETAPDL